jgi:hypothetical protein
MSNPDSPPTSGPGLEYRSGLFAAGVRAQAGGGKELTGHQRTREEALAQESAALKVWELFTDPREGIQRLQDGTPILLMPVRLETRFKTFSNIAGIAAQAAQLWVRVYPDDCWIDSFDPVLTDTEVVAAKDYWIAFWQAGGIEDQQRGAWSAPTRPPGRTTFSG